MTEPIKPSDITKTRKDLLIEEINNLILKKWDGQSATISQSEIKILCSIQEIISIYKDVGWIVGGYEVTSNNHSFHSILEFSKNEQS